ncbi:MAG: cytochrome c [Candidatus Hydrogenedentes bacterium]|nr:cytochrome c [Candidatus Hydrogenedentota bacterium]
MKRLIGFSILAVAAVAMFAQAITPRAAEAADESDLVARGKYIVHSMSQCVQCHSPRDEQGNLIESQLLTGGRIPFSSPYPNETWATRAPSLIDMSGYEEDQAIRLLTTGITRRGVPPQSPMPPFRMTDEDARAVYLYLNSL